VIGHPPLDRSIVDIWTTGTFLPDEDLVVDLPVGYPGKVKGYSVYIRGSDGNRKLTVSMWRHLSGRDYRLVGFTNLDDITGREGVHNIDLPPSEQYRVRMIR